MDSSNVAPARYEIDSDAGIEKLKSLNHGYNSGPGFSDVSRNLVERKTKKQPKK